MQLSLQYGTTLLQFEVLYSKRKTLEIAIEPPDKITVTAPEGTSEEVILQKVKQKANWLIAKMFTFRNMMRHKIQREFVSGESFMYLGRNYSMQIIIDENIKKPEVKLLRGKFYVTAPSKDEIAIKEAMEVWYRRKAEEQVKARLKYYAPYFSEQPTAIKIKEQKKRWGSCTSKNELLFNWRAVMAKAPALDYIIVHEMCHLTHKDHSKDFWQQLSMIMPDYEVRKEWLRNYGINMDL